jgi:YHS domain-containing protein
MRILFLIAVLLFVTFRLFAQSSKPAVFSTKAGAIRGYDPVAYFTQSKPVKGQETITHTWNGAVWHFASSQNRDLFAKNPEKYAPQYGGYCAYGWSQGYAVKTEPEAWSVVNGKLYLNYDMDIRNTWEKDKDEYIKLADKNWKGRQ